MKCTVYSTGTDYCAKTCFVFLADVIMHILWIQILGINKIDCCDTGQKKMNLIHIMSNYQSFLRMIKEEKDSKSQWHVTSEDKWIKVVRDLIINKNTMSTSIYNNLFYQRNDFKNCSRKVKLQI